MSGRFALRHGTQGAHTALEAETGPLDNRASYRRYVAGLYAFRASLEPAVAQLALELTGLVITEIAADLAQDLADLDMPLPRLEQLPPPHDISDMLGAVYVLEGSALGARVLIRNVESLGLNAGHGARHLWRQAHSPTAWREVVKLLDTQTYDARRTLAAANAAFTLAHDCMKRVSNA